MFIKLRDFWTSLCVEGIHLPFSFDPETNKPSITLMFFWISSTLSVASLILLHIGIVTYTATAMSLGFVLLAFVMYRMRKLDKVKINLTEKSIELGDNTIEKDSK